MNLFSKVTAAGALAFFGIASSAAFELVSPAPGSTTTVDQIAKVTLTFDEETLGMPSNITISNKATGELVGSYTGDVDWNDFHNFDYAISPAISTPGEYVVNVPENVDSDQSSPAYEFYYIVEGKSYTTQPGVPTTVTPTPGTEVVQSDDPHVEFTTIRLDFAEDDGLIGALTSQWTLTNEAGEKIPFSIGGFYLQGDPMLAYAPNPFITLSFNSDGLLPSGTYTLTIPAGSIDLDRGALAETLTYTWNYVKTTPDADSTPLEITEAWIGQAMFLGQADNGRPNYEWIGTDKTPFTNGTAVPDFTACLKNEAGTGILMTVNHGEKTGYMTYYILDLSTNAQVAQGPMYKQEDGSFLFASAIDRRFFNDRKYLFHINAYSADSDTAVEFGDGAEIEFTGSSEAYQFSPAYLAAINPETNLNLSDITAKKTVLTSMDQRKLTLVFSRPVTLTRCAANLGFGASMNADKESKNGEAYDLVWYVYIPEYIMSDYPAVEMIFAAEDENGLLVEGNYGEEENSCFQIPYELTLCQPRVVIGQTNSHVPELNIFTITSSATGEKAGLNCSYMAYPVILNEKGETVAEINNNYYYDPETYTDYPYEPVIWSAGSEPQPLELRFQMVPAITTPGKYTLHFPATAINFGNQFVSDGSVEQNFDFVVCEFVNVDFSDGNCTVALPAVEKGHTTTLNVTPAENWTLESLTLNGTEVKDDVVNNLYTSPALSEAAHFVASFAFDGVVVIPTGADEIVTDLELRAWSEGGAMYLSGLKDGQIVRLFSVAGSLIETQTVADAETLKFEAPAAQTYVITVTEGEKTVAIKLLNK
ncbi:MAG: hypothetical protein HDS14_01295 [Bacteroides sp.]|nr:hypothetical protein [Bacteroides sp.]